MDLQERGKIQQEAESLLNSENRLIFKNYEQIKEETAKNFFGVGLLELNDNQFEQATSLARELVPGAEGVLTTLAELEDWLIESRRK